MIGFDVKIEGNIEKAIGAQSAPVAKAKFNSFVHAGASIRKDAIASIRYGGKKPKYQKMKRQGRKGTVAKRYKASAPGTPPHWHRSLAFIRQGIMFAASKENVSIGPTASKFGESMSPHEHGGMYRGANYPARPFMGPALERNLYRIGQSWQGSIGQ